MPQFEGEMTDGGQIHILCTPVPALWTITTWDDVDSIPPRSSVWEIINFQNEADVWCGSVLKTMRAKI